MFQRHIKARSRCTECTIMNTISSYMFKESIVILPKYTDTQ